MVYSGDDASLRPPRREATLEYLLDMLAGLAQMARDAEEVGVAIHLEAIIAARRASAISRPAR